jgi:hypothetical protein
MGTAHEDLISFTKFRLLYPLNKAFKTYPLPRPKGLVGDWPFKGKLLHFLSGHLNHWERPKIAAILWSLYQLKRAMISAPGSFVQKTMLDHRQCLSEVPPKCSDLEASYPYEYPKLTRAMRKIFVHVDTSPLKGPKGMKVYDPSLGASVESSRSMGGQASSIASRAYKLLGLSPGVELTKGPFHGIFIQKIPVNSPPRYIQQSMRQFHGGAVGPRSASLGLMSVSEGGIEIYADDYLSALRDSVLARIVQFRTRHVFPGSRWFRDTVVAPAPDREEWIRERELMTWSPSSKLPGVKAKESLVGGWISGLHPRPGPIAIVAPVLEPLKCRLVSKGPPDLYWLSKGLQITLWKHLSRLPATVLVGRPLFESDLVDLFSKSPQCGPENSDWYDISSFSRVRSKSGITYLKDMRWISVDYKSSTDYINMNLTLLGLKMVLDMLGDRIPELRKGSPWYECYMSVLGPHVIHYPGNGVDDIEPFLQTNGQLMGSILSFPFLCMLNLAVFWAAWTEFTQRTWKLEDLPVLVNGDDMLCYAHKSFVPVLQRYQKLVGFVPSPGKYWWHPYLASINTQLFSVSSTYEHRYKSIRETLSGQKTKVPWSQLGMKHLLAITPLDPWKIGVMTKPRVNRLDFINFGLLVGTSKLGNIHRVGTEKFGGLVDSYTQSVGRVEDSESRLRLHRRFLHYHKDEVAKYTQNGLWNLFIAPEYGGVGLPHYDGIPNEVTSFQHQFAAYRRRLLRRTFSGNIPEELPVRQKPPVWSFNQAFETMTKVPPGVRVQEGHRFVSTSYRPFREDEFDLKEDNLVIDYLPIVDSFLGFNGYLRPETIISHPRSRDLKEFRSEVEDWKSRKLPEKERRRTDSREGKPLKPGRGLIRQGGDNRSHQG